MTSLDIINFRKTNGLSQKELANLLGVSPNTKYNYENGGKIRNSKFLYEFFTKKKESLLR